MSSWRMPPAACSCASMATWGCAMRRRGAARSRTNRPGSAATTATATHCCRRCAGPASCSRKDSCGKRHDWVHRPRRDLAGAEPVNVRLKYKRSHARRPRPPNVACRPSGPAASHPVSRLCGRAPRHHVKGDIDAGLHAAARGGCHGVHIRRRSLGAGLSAKADHHRVVRGSRWRRAKPFARARPVLDDGRLLPLLGESAAHKPRDRVTAQGFSQALIGVNASFGRPTMRRISSSSSLGRRGRSHASGMAHHLQ
jgi:hypothetical protein